MRRFLVLLAVATLLGGGWLGLLGARADRGSLPAGGERELDEPISTRHTDRIAGADAFETAAAVSQAAFPGGSYAAQPRTVLLARTSRWQDLLVATRLMAEPFDAPLLLLADDGSLPEATEGELGRLHPEGLPLDQGVQALVVGEGSEELDRRLDASGLRRRVIGGENPAALAAAVDDYRARVDGRYSRVVLVVSDDDPSQAIPAAAWAALTGDAILFAGRDDVPEETLAQLSLRSRPAIYVLGPREAIADSVVAKLGTFGPVQRIGGADAPTTAVAFARFRDTVEAVGWGINSAGARFIVVSFDDPAVALPAAALARHGGGPLLPLGRIVPLAVRQYLESLRPAPALVKGQRGNRAVIVGPVRMVPKDSQSRLDALLHWVEEP